MRLLRIVYKELQWAERPPASTRAPTNFTSSLVWIDSHPETSSCIFVIRAAVILSEWFWIVCTESPSFPNLVPEHLGRKNNLWEDLARCTTVSQHEGKEGYWAALCAEVSQNGRLLLRKLANFTATAFSALWNFGSARICSSSAEWARKLTWNCAYFFC